MTLKRITIVAGLLALLAFGCGTQKKIARFRNNAERSGKVDLEFLIKVPRDMLDANGSLNRKLWPR